MLLLNEAESGEVWTPRPVKNEERAYLVPDEVEYGEHAKFTMDEFVMNAVKVRVPFTIFESNVLQFLCHTPSPIHPNNWVFMKAFECLVEYKGTWSSL